MPTIRRSGPRFAEVLDATETSRHPAFERWWAGLVRLEGTLQQWQAQPANAADRGGRTHFGITERAFLACAGAAGLPRTRDAFEGMTKPQARAVALAIWKTSGAHRIDDPGVAVMVGDWFWGSNTRAWQGIRNVLEELSIHSAPVGPTSPQATGSTSAEGESYRHPQALDERSVALLNSLPPALLVERLAIARKTQHATLVQRAPDQSVFLRGWQRRVDVQTTLALSMTGTSDAQHVTALGPSDPTRAPTNSVRQSAPRPNPLQRPSDAERRGLPRVRQFAVSSTPETGLPAIRPIPA